MAFAANPVCLLLDEPSTGLAVATLEALAEALRTMTARGVSMLIAEQNPTWLATMAERAYLLSLGRITAAGRPYEVLGVDGDGRGDA
jgi:branched-chain amino acid transport system ATP-binding protein